MVDKIETMERLHREEGERDEIMLCQERDREDRMLCEQREPQMTDWVHMARLWVPNRERERRD